MDKDKVLEKSRAAKNDEGKEHIKINSYRYAYIPAMATAGFLLGFTHPVFDYPLLFVIWLGAVVLSGAVGEFFARYRFSGKKSFLTATIFSIIGIVALLILYVIMTR